MFRFFLRFLGILGLVLTVITAVLDITKSIANSSVSITTLGQHWFDTHRESLSLSQSAIQRYVHPLIWDPVIQTVLLRPSWLVFFIFALIFLWLGRDRSQTWHTKFRR